MRNNLFFPKLKIKCGETTWMAWIKAWKPRVVSKNNTW